MIILAKLGVILGIGLFTISINPAGGIKGSVQPKDAANFVYAIQGNDTLKTSLQDGNFQFANAPAGNYRLIVMAKPPYKMVIKDDVVVSDGSTTDVGIIKFKK
ncbi:carboxypeptidase-like regulatory domain-containing protein [Gynurincola endophyticus]|uniref:carboxypeptidase-like regulatory domain-containing protein n=1 Tax=Gynurincola endophyticus TaxID=2479004 RepID=UPI000F8D47E7|nr:carboxypeptidase-like regulatory domain-containing protein [Gynurincola endophyticus]